MEDSLGEREKEALEQLLQELEEFFIRPQENASAVAQQRESLNTEAKQKPPAPEKTKPEWSLQEKEEVERMLKVGFIRSNECPTWLSNMMKATKVNNIVRCCMDFQRSRTKTRAEEELKRELEHSQIYQYLEHDKSPPKTEEGEGRECIPEMNHL